MSYPVGAYNQPPVPGYQQPPPAGYPQPSPTGYNQPPVYYAQAPPVVQTAMAPPPVQMNTNVSIIAPFKGGESYGGATWTYSDKAISIVYKAPLSTSYKCIGCCGFFFNLLNCGRFFCGCLTCSCICDYLYFEERIHPRSYQAVYENRIEFNYPYHICFGQCVSDGIISKHLDQVQNFTESTCCSFYHLPICIFSCVSDVLSEAPCALVNWPLCFCCRTFYPAINDAQKFLQHFNEAQSAFASGNRVVPKFMPLGPQPGDKIPQ